MAPQVCCVVRCRAALVGTLLQWAGLIAIADQIAGSNLGYINPALYEIASAWAHR